ncbi:uncharacterized protein BJ171DRAFT_484301 [Polychytrium aggregatum]|uniref:uncharacterized protein n=1 Tax=Polychytrium aggregatum TaxID=110093 RepID=UPI0022FE236C|nr:uncharacterized protein BJ171DRAFT_484301 [Polychytrium aggregatum]KAI9209533.1 hypothetical protein BJ171DRAFT_484301 [Polychytrium aggregatum]
MVVITTITLSVIYGIKVAADRYREYRKSLASPSGTSIRDLPPDVLQRIFVLVASPTSSSASHYVPIGVPVPWLNLDLDLELLFQLATVSKSWAQVAVPLLWSSPTISSSLMASELKTIVESSLMGEIGVDAMFEYPEFISAITIRNNALSEVDDVIDTSTLASFLPLLPNLSRLQLDLPLVDYDSRDASDILTCLLNPSLLNKLEHIKFPRVGVAQAATLDSAIGLLGEYGNLHHLTSLDLRGLDELDQSVRALLDLCGDTLKLLWLPSLSELSPILPWIRRHGSQLTYLAVGKWSAASPEEVAAFFQDLGQLSALEINSEILDVVVESVQSQCYALSSLKINGHINSLSFAHSEALQALVQRIEHYDGPLGDFLEHGSSLKWLKLTDESNTHGRIRSLLGTLQSVQYFAASYAAFDDLAEILYIIKTHAGLDICIIQGLDDERDAGTHQNYWLGLDQLMGKGINSGSISTAAVLECVDGDELWARAIRRVLASDSAIGIDLGYENFKAKLDHVSTGLLTFEEALSMDFDDCINGSDGETEA